MAEGLRYVGDEGTLSWYVLRLANRVAAWVSVDNADPHRAVWAYDARRETALYTGFGAAVVLTAVSVGPDPADVEVREHVSGDHIRAVLYPALPYLRAEIGRASCRERV